MKRLVVVSFPRSGSYFLTYCMSCYFGQSLKYLEPYSNISTFPEPRFSSRFLGARHLNFRHFLKKNKRRLGNPHPLPFGEANFIRFHDFSSFTQRSLYMSAEGAEIEKNYCLDNVENQANTCYLILIRHPIETIQSYFELLVHASGLTDSMNSWTSFQEHALEYWMNFADKWVLNPNDPLIKNKTVVLYEDLAKNTTAALSKVICCFDHKKLDNTLIKKIAGLRYSSTRHISDFKYFNAESCENIQDALHDSYLRPMGITPYTEFTRSPSHYHNKLFNALLMKKN